MWDTTRVSGQVWVFFRVRSRPRTGSQKSPGPGTDPSFDTVLDRAYRDPGFLPRGVHTPLPEETKGSTGRVEDPWECVPGTGTVSPLSSS